jgi:long-subunit acyl-CoA synthetase (AMP-forming)
MTLSFDSCPSHKGTERRAEPIVCLDLYRSMTTASLTYYHFHPSFLLHALVSNGLCIATSSRLEEKRTRDRTWSSPTHHSSGQKLKEDTNLAMDTDEEVPERSREDENRYHCMDQLVHLRAKTHANNILLSYPTAAEDSTYIDINGARLELLTRVVAVRYGAVLEKHLESDLRMALPNRCCIDNITVAMVGISSLEYAITEIALQRLGVKLMLISPRLAMVGFAHLLRVTNCNAVVASGSSLDVLARVREELHVPVQLIAMLTLEEILRIEAAEATGDGPSILTAMLSTGEDDSPGMIMHTGGTTGLPKPVPFRSGRWLSWTASRFLLGRTLHSPTLCTVPLFHSFGQGTMLVNLCHGTRLVMVRAERPPTVASLWKALDDVQARRLATVPYLLKFFAETPGGLERLANLEEIAVGGAAVPTDLGNDLVNAGVRLLIGYGQTESGPLMHNIVDENYKTDWLYYVPMEHTEKFLRFEHIGGGLHHLICLPGLKQLVMSDRPDGSYGTKDLFVKHPSDMNKWKFVARHDDIIVMVNGEKADPHPLEEAMCANPNVQTAVTFGSMRDALGMIVIPSEKSRGLTRDQLVESLMPSLELGNARASAWARIALDSLLVKEVGTQFPMTDKSTVIRPHFLTLFEKEIEEFYKERERNTSQTNSGNVEDMSDAEVKKTVRSTLESELRATNDREVEWTDETDFFAAGMDSLQAVNVRARLMRDIPLGGRRLATNVVFDHPTVTQLTQHLLEVRLRERDENSNGLTSSMSIEGTAMRLVQKYSNFVQPSVGTVDPADGFVVVSHPEAETFGTNMSSLTNAPLSRFLPVQLATLVVTSYTPSSCGTTSGTFTASSGPSITMQPPDASAKHSQTLGSGKNSTQNSAES